MKKIRVLYLILLITTCSVMYGDLLDYNDGQTYDISSYLSGPLARIDYGNYGPSTTVNILPEASVYKFEVYNEGTLNLLGGTVRDELWGKDFGHINVESGYVNMNIHARNNSILTMSGGSVRADIVSADNAQCSFSNATTDRIITYHNSQFTVNSGLITGACRTYGDSLLNIHGGIFKELFQAVDTSTIAFYGSNFSIDGNPLESGQYYSTDFTGGQLRGVLENGDNLNVNFSFWGSTPSRLIIIPEPATLSLLALGTMLAGIRRK